MSFIGLGGVGHPTPPLYFANWKPLGHFYVSSSSLHSQDSLASFLCYHINQFLVSPFKIKHLDLVDNFLPSNFLVTPFLPHDTSTFRILGSHFATSSNDHHSKGFNYSFYHQIISFDFASISICFAFGVTLIPFSCSTSTSHSFSFSFSSYQLWLEDTLNKLLLHVPGLEYLFFWSSKTLGRGEALRERLYGNSR